MKTTFTPFLPFAKQTLAKFKLHRYVLIYILIFYSTVILAKAQSLGNLPDPIITVNGAVPATGIPAGACFYQNSFLFGVTSINSGATYLWDFGDGVTIVSTSPSHTYATTGNFKVHVVATLGNVSKYYDQFINIYPTPNPSFNVYPGASKGNAYSFQSTSNIASGYIASYIWNFGDGTSDITSNPTKTYNAEGIYPVKLIVVSDNGCKDSITQNITITRTNAILNAAFNVNTVTNSCFSASNSFVFTNTSSTGTDINYLWDFGDGTTATTYNPTHQYTKPGSYIVRLTVSNSTQTVYATPVTISLNPVPVPEFLLYLNTTLTSLSSEVKRCFTPGMDFSFMSSSTVQSGQMHYKWSFATNAIYFRDGDSVDYINPRIVFDTAGIYPVKLVVSTDKGCKDSITHVIKLGHPHAHHQTLVDYAGDKYANPTVTLTNDSYDHQLAITNWQWNFGNGTTSTLQQPGSFHYNCGGTYNVALRIVDEIPCTSDTASVIVIKIRPHALFSVSVPNYTPDVYARPTFTFTDNTTINDGCPNLAYNWNFGDGYTSNTKNPTHIFMGSGVYNVRLIVTNHNGGLKDTITQQLTVAIKPKAGFSTSQSLIADVYASPTVAITNTSSSTDTAAPVSALQYVWDFGDGNSISGFNPSHVYASGGTYTIKLTVTNPISGLTDVTTHTVNIVIKPKADFGVGTAVYSPDVYAQPSYTFTNASSVNDASGSLTYAWSFGDGSAISNAISPSHVYTASGTYTVTLVVTNANGGATDTKTATVTVVIKPKADFSVGSAVFSPNVYAQPSYTFTNTSSVNDASGNLTYVWNFGDGVTSTATSPSHTYTAGGTYTVTLVVTNANGGATDTKTGTVTVVIKPIADFNVGSAVFSPNVYAQPSYTFTNTSSVNDVSGNLIYAWNFGDGSAISNAISPSHVYTASGTYTVTLVVTNANGGATDTKTATLSVVIKPKADFGVGTAVYSPDVYAQPSYTFTNISSVNDVSGNLTYAWNFGDGATSTSTSTSPTHTYTASGTYTVTLVVTNANGGATDTKTATVTVAIKPKASFTTSVSNNNGGYPVVSIVNNSTVNETATLVYSWTYGDGVGTSINATPTPYTYVTGAASRDITVVVTNPNSGLTDTYTVTSSNVYILPSNVTYSVPTTDLTVNYIASATDNSGGTLSYSWNFNDGTGGTSSSASGAYTFAAAGTYNASLTVTSSNGGSITLSPIAITVTNPVPVAKITIRSLINNGDGTSSFQIIANDNANPSTISSGSIVSYEWSSSYVDNIGTTIVNPISNGAALAITNFPNTYTLSLTLKVTSDKGVSNTATASINVGSNGFSGATVFSGGTPRQNIPVLINLFKGIATLYPNPATSEVTVKYKTISAGEVVIKVYDVTGRQVLQQGAVRVSASQNNTSIINVSSLPKGTYEVEINMNGAKLFSSQLIKVQ